MRGLILSALVVALWPMAHAKAQESQAASTTAPNAQDSMEEAEEAAAWSVSLSMYAYLVSGESDYVQPTLAVDYDWLHLEGRYNYEDRDTASVWAGYNFSVGDDDIVLDITPMIGGVFGDTEGVAPGYKATLTWGNLELYTEGEYLFDSNNSSDDFFYTWSELTYSFTDWFYAGLVVQRTKAYDSDFDIDRGLLFGFAFETVEFTTYILNPDEDATVVFSIGFGF